MLTVLLATRNRSKILRLVLQSFCELQAPKSGWKLVIVDNGSSDQTSDTVKAFSNKLSLTLLTEPREGKNVALNTALSKIDGDLTILTDDDVFPRSDWLLQFRRAADTHLDFQIFGGSIVPRWETEPPNWVKWADQGAAYAVTDPAWTEGPIAANCVWGPNMAIRSSVFDSGVRFDTSIGPNGKNYAQGGDTELTRRLEGRGLKAWHVRDAIVQHYIRTEQLDLAWMMRRATRHGRGEYRLGHLEELNSRRRLLGVPGYLYRRLLREARNSAVSWLFHREGDLHRARWRFNFVRGQIQEAKAQYRNRCTVPVTR